MHHFPRRLLSEKAQHSVNGWRRPRCIDRGSVRLLRQLFTSLIGGNRQMQVCRGCQVQKVLQVDLAWCRINQVSSANDVSHFLMRIADSTGEVIRKDAVGAIDDKVADRRGQVLPDLSLQ